MFIAASILVSCGPVRKKRKHAVVHAFKVLGEVASDLDDSFFYMITDGNGCYTATSKTPLSNFSGVNWTRSSTMPSLKEAQELEKMEIPEEELEIEVQEDMTADPSDFESADADGSDGGSDGGDGGGDSGGDGGGGDGGGGGD